MATTFADVGVEAVTTPATEHEVRVRRGALLLDATVPGWAHKVDVETLDLSECDRCVLGQLFGEFDELLYGVMGHLPSAEAVDVLGVPSGGRMTTHRWAVEHGFNLARAARRRPGGPEREMCYRALRPLWIAEIRDRRLD